MKEYHDLLQKILDKGMPSADRTGTGTLSLFGEQIRLDVTQGFPVLTTKKIHFSSVVAELLWMISGSTNAKILQKQGVRIWNEWASDDGEIGPIYGHQFRNAGATKKCELVGMDTNCKPEWDFSYETDGVDQLYDLIEGIKKDPYSRRHVMTMWAPKDLPYQRLACCHGTVIQYYIRDGKISCHMYQRSCDSFLSLPFNIASYALLLHMIGQQTGYVPAELIISFGDVHIYKNHIDQVKLQLSREPYPLPKLILHIKDSVFEYRKEDITLENYQHHPAIKAPVSV